jgi:heat shock protein HslJ
MKNNSILAWIGVIVAVVIVIIVWHLGLFGGTTSTTSTNTTVTTSTSSATPVHSLDGTTFRFTSYDSTTIPAGENYLMEFSGGTLHGGVCENFSGPYSAKNGTISATLISSPKGCAVPIDINAADQIFHTVLAQISTYTYIGDVLTITGSGHTLVFNAFLK